jgi:hypothetical protein
MVRVTVHDTRRPRTAKYTHTFKIVKKNRLIVTSGSRHLTKGLYGKLSYLRRRVEYTLFCNLQSRAGTHAILVYYLKLLIYKQKIIMNTFACFMDHENNLSPPLFTGTVHKLHFTSVFYVICLAPIHFIKKTEKNIYNHPLAPLYCM